MKVITSELLRKFFNKLSDIFAKKQHTHTKSEVGLSNVDNTADANKNVKYATSASMLTGFHEAIGAQTWGNQTGSFISGMNVSNNGSLAFRKDNPIAGELSAIIDGRWYQNEGRYMCIDTDNYKDYCAGKNGDGASGTWKINITGSVNGHTVNSDVPENAVFTDTKTIVVNNLTTTTPGSALDAAQGRILSAQLNEAINELSMNKVMTESFSSGSIKITSPITTFYNHHSFSSDIVDLYAINPIGSGATYQLDLSYFTDSKIALMNGDMSTVYTVSISNNTVTISGNCSTYWVIRYNRDVTTVTHP